MRTRLLLAAALLTLAVAAPGRAALPPVKHVFVIVLENKDFDQSFGATSPATYLSKELTAKGQLLEQYFGTSHVSLGNYITMVSGQAPNPDTQSDCINGFKDVFPGTPTPDGQVLGSGCVYPRSILTVADQLEAKGLTWKGYMQDMANGPAGTAKTCRHPAIGETDDTQSARVGDQYATRHNPFVYFHSIIDEQATCDANVVPLERLATDLQSPASTPSYAFITPNLCEDGHDAPCVDGRPGGLESADAFLRAWVPQILASPAYAQGGLVLITWDEGNFGPSSAGACCAQPTGPNTPAPGVFGPGGGRTGTVVLSPWTKAGTRNATPYNHYSLLRSVEDLFGLTHLGYAGQAGLRAFGDDVFNGAGGPTATPASPAKRCRFAAKLSGRTLRVTARATRTLRVTLAGRRVKAPARVRACQTVAVRLPAGHGRVVVRLGPTTRGFRR
jgi:hypothetical protein